jgi:hypothetical protein
MASDDQPEVLAELITRHGIALGHSLADFTQLISTRMDATIRAAFSHGVAEGMEMCAQAAELYAAHIEQEVPEAPVIAEYIRQLRDQMRMAALSVPT